jgi:hypothetical protein
MFGHERRIDLRDWSGQAVEINRANLPMSGRCRM